MTHIWKLVTLRSKVESFWQKKNSFHTECEKNKVAFFISILQLLGHFFWNKKNVLWMMLSIWRQLYCFVSSVEQKTERRRVSGHLLRNFHKRSSYFSKLTKQTLFTFHPYFRSEKKGQNKDVKRRLSKAAFD